MAKLTRESKLRDKRLIKAAKKDARKREAELEGPASGDRSIADASYMDLY
jgi:hypothetical protein